MSENRMDRRGALRALAGTAAACCLVPSLRAAASTPRVRLGGPVSGAPADPEGLALAHVKAGYRAAYCPPIPLEDRERLRDLRNAFARHDVVLAEVGRWCNLMDADAGTRAKNLALVAEGLALAEEAGARCCVDIAGSFHPTVWYGPHPDNLSRRFFDAAVENARKIIDAVKPRRAKFTYEVMGWALPDSPDSYLELIKAIDRPAFGAHLDPCNLINSPGRYYRNTELLNECFDKLGPHIASCHAKDVTWDVEMQVHFREVVVGTGTLDYATYLKRLAALPQGPPLMLEHMKGPEEYERCRRHIQQVAEEAGVSLG
jgi:sugar phosphate isomerase/epimerase